MSADRPTPSRYRRIEAGSVRAATIRIFPPQLGQVSTVSPKVRASSAVHPRKDRLVLGKFVEIVIENSSAPQQTDHAVRHRLDDVLAHPPKPVLSMRRRTNDA
jgi:hypothetical protein